MRQPTQKKVRGIFVNTSKKRCSIHESGMMVFDCIKQSKHYNLEYIRFDDIDRFSSDSAVDFWVFNYHPYAMADLDTSGLRRLSGRVFTIVLETLPGDPFALCPREHFDAYICLDPTLTADGRVYPFPRPLETPPAVLPSAPAGVPVIGSFGFPTVGKGFELVVDAVNREFDRAIVRINVPDGDFTGGTALLHGENYTDHLERLCRQAAKPGVQIDFTRKYLSKAELISWCAGNSLNCFLYTRQQPGLSATTDQAIVSGRPLAVSDNPTFRHIHAHIQPYPYWSLQDSLERSPPIVRELGSLWGPATFAKRFHALLQDFHLLPRADAPKAEKDPKPGPMALGTAEVRPVVLVVNHASQRCGIHEYGRNLADALSSSRSLTVHYCECDDAETLKTSVDRVRPNLLLLNYNPGTMPWFTAEVSSRYAGLPRVELRHEFAQDVDVPDDPRFSHHILPDPTLDLEGPRLFSCGRYVPYFTMRTPAPRIPTIGSFGFGTPNKGFDELILRVQHEFDEAIIRLNIPWNDVVDPEGRMAHATVERCRRLLFKDSIHLSITHDFLDREGILDWLSANTLNAFFYNGPSMLGISSVVDYALAVDRPLAVTMNPMFRHLRDVRPKIMADQLPLKEIIAAGTAGLVSLRNDWSPARYRQRLEDILLGILLKRQTGERDAPQASAPASPAKPERPAGQSEPAFNRVLDDMARAHYEPVVALMREKCPDLILRKIPRANVQQAFVLDTVLGILTGIGKTAAPRTLCVGSFEDTAAETLTALGWGVDKIDPAINTDLDGFMRLRSTHKESYDVIFSTSVIEHVPDDGKFAENIADLLKLNGVAVLTLDFNDAYRPGARLPLVDERLYRIADLTDRLLPRMKGCRLIDTPQWDAPPDFDYEGCRYGFATLVVRKTDADPKSAADSAATMRVE